ncbi:MAG: hypothetical protein OWS74_09310, partial [Firmicutes bacterium]|nr:hypothetical protein [Bacillota bacterium]
QKNRPWQDIRRALWLLAYFAFGTLLSKFGSFGGTGWIAQPWDSIFMAAGSLGFYYWALAAGKSSAFEEKPLSINTAANE